MLLSDVCPLKGDNKDKGNDIYHGTQLVLCLIQILVDSLLIMLPPC